MTDLGHGRFYVARDQMGRRHFIYEPELRDFSMDTSVYEIAADPEADQHLPPSTHLRVYPDATYTREERIRFWDAYLNARTGTYEFRCRRYDTIIATLRSMGMRRSDTIADIGAGRMEFAQRLREQDHVGLYIPIDGAIDGCDLNTWDPPDNVDWAVAIEVVEHLHEPFRLMTNMKIMARFGIAITTPNPATVDVIALDPTHLTPVSARDLADHGYLWRSESLFTELDDTLVAWFDRKALARRQIGTAR